METVCPSCKKKFQLFEAHSSQPKVTILCPFCRQKITVGKSVKPYTAPVRWEPR